MATRSDQHLAASFVGWKALLLAVAVASPGPGYDTSTALLLQLPQPDLDAPDTAADAGLSFPASLVRRLVRRLIRWDAIYFSSIAAHGHQHEQQWAFGWGYARLVGTLTAGEPLPSSDLPSCAATVLSRLTAPARSAVHSPEAQALTAVVLNLCCHLASVLLLHHLCLQLLGPSPRARRLAYVAALLHVLAPAGMFLCAPHGESLFSALSFLGSLLYVCGLRHRTLASDACLILAGLAYGLSSTVRSNGILAGSVFAVDLALALPRALGDVRVVRRCAALVAGGLLVGAGFAAPQVIAYYEYCRPGLLGSRAPRRSWCDRLPPSIYNFVQNHYWNMGFGKYWTLSNVPLFVLAMPMLTIMFVSSVSALSAARSRRLEPTDEWMAGMWRFALPQLLLTVLTLTNFHVQIITRIATGYFVHYVWIAMVFERRDKLTILRRQFDVSKAITRWMVVYGIVQGGLYASHLPPA